MKLPRFLVISALLVLSACIEDETQDFDNADDIAYLEDYADRDDVTITDSGLMYRVLETGDGDSPEQTSEVRVHYTATLVDGEVIDSSHDRDEPARFFVNDLITGFSEGLMLMQEGDIFELVLPDFLAYGEFPPPGSGIHPGATLIFEVELIEIITEEEEEENGDDNDNGDDNNGDEENGNNDNNDDHTEA